MDERDVMAWLTFAVIAVIIWTSAAIAVRVEDRFGFVAAFSQGLFTAVLAFAVMVWMLGGHEVLLEAAGFGA